MGLLNKQLKLFFKNKLFCIILLAIFLLIFVVSTIFFIGGADFIFIFYLFVRYNFVVSLMFCGVSFLFFKLSKNSHIDECISVASNHKASYLKFAILVQIILLLYINIFVILILLTFAITTNEMSVFFKCITSYYLFNIFLPQLTSLIITLLISEINHAKASILIFILFIVFTTPYLETFDWRVKPFIPFDQLMYYVQKPFTYFYQNGKWSIDTLYGYQNEPYKMAIFIFWNSAAVLMLYKNKIKYRKLQYTIYFLVLFLLFSSIYIPQSLCRVDKKWNGTYSDINYYGVLENKNTYIETKSIDYNVDNYNLNIEIGNKLSVSGDIELSSLNDQREYTLTLYHGYRLARLECKNLLSYTQDGDYIYI